MDTWHQFGLVGIMAGAIITILWRMIVWVMAFVKDQNKFHSEERAIWHSTIERFNEAQNGIIQSLNRHNEKAEERGRYVREEHKQMIETLSRINGFKH